MQWCSRERAWREQHSFVRRFTECGVPRGIFDPVERVKPNNAFGITNPYAVNGQSVVACLYAKNMYGRLKATKHGAAIICPKNDKLATHRAQTHRLEQCIPPFIHSSNNRSKHTRVCTRLLSRLRFCTEIPISDSKAASDIAERATGTLH